MLRLPSRRPIFRLLALLLALCQLTGPLAHAEHVPVTASDAPVAAHCHDGGTDHPAADQRGSHCALCAQGCSCTHAASIVMPLPGTGSGVPPVVTRLPYHASPFLARIATRLFRPPEVT